MPRLGRVRTPRPVEWDHPLNRGLVLWLYGLPQSGWWGGDRWVDLTGRHHGTLTNGAAWVATPHGPGVAFDGTDDIVTTDATVVSGGITIAVLARLLADGAYTYLLGNTFRAHGLRIPSGRTPSLSSNVADVATSSVSIGSDWVLLVGTLDGTTGRIYVDGVERGSGASAASGFEDGGGLTLGGRGFGASCQNCDIAGGWLWSRAMPAAEVAALYDQVRRGHPDTLRRRGRRAWLFWDLNAGGGGVGVALSAVSGRGQVIGAEVSVGWGVISAPFAGRGVLGSHTVQTAVNAILAPISGEGRIFQPGVFVGSAAAVGAQTAVGVLPGVTSAVGWVVSPGFLTAIGLVEPPTVAAGSGVVLNPLPAAGVTENTTVTSESGVLLSTLTASGLVVQPVVAAGAEVSLPAVGFVGTLRPVVAGASQIVQTSPLEAGGVLVSQTVYSGVTVSPTPLSVYGVPSGTPVTVGNAVTPTPVPVAGTVVSPTIRLNREVVLAPVSARGTPVPPIVVFEMPDVRSIKFTRRESGQRALRRPAKKSGRKFSWDGSL